MSDRMTPLKPAELLEQILTEHENHGTIYGVLKFFHASPNKMLNLFEEQLEVPFGPAAGPHTQLTQNIIASYVAGSRFFELKTVQTLDGEDLPVAKPCIRADDECYNVEWSTELRVPEALDEYIKAWFILKLISKEYGLGHPDGFMFNMSVGYDFEGISSKKINAFMDGLKDASNLPVWQECKEATLACIDRFNNIDEAYINAITPNACNSITLSTLHGCPPAEIERIASYLIDEKALNTFIKCNPTLLGYEYARKTMDDLGFDYMVFDDHHFKNDLQYEDAIPMINRLLEKASKKGVSFGVKLTNTFPVKIAQKELPGEEMYMSGRSLFPLTVSLADKLSKEFKGKLRVSFSGGADAFNIKKIYDAGIWPITLATTLLKAGGYNRLKQMAQELSACTYKEWNGVDLNAVAKLKELALHDAAYKKPVKPIPQRKMEKKVPLIDCFAAPCSEGCPIHQDIPAYVGLVGEGQYLEALQVIVDKNPLPFMTGTICNHRCMDKCTRNFYEESVQIRETKLVAAENAFDELLATMEVPEKTGAPAAVIGGGAAGLATAYFLARNGLPVTIFDRSQELGGIVRNIVPSFRVPSEVVEKDVQLVEKMGVKFVTGKDAPSIEELKKQGFAYIILAIGAYKMGNLELEKGTSINVLEFLTRSRNGENQSLGTDVVIVGGGNTAMDAARAAKREKGVENVKLVYRRTKRYMPADEEELVLAMEDGVEFMELLAPLSHENGILTCQKMVLGAPDSSGRRSPQPTNEYVEVPATSIIAAVGEHVDDAYLNANGVTTNERCYAIVDSQLQTSIPNVYIAGDAHRGPATIVEAIADAATIADAICCGQEQSVYTFEGENIRDRKGILLKAADAECEAQRCLECDIVCECCVDVCPNRANVSVLVDGASQIVHVDKLCNECGNCLTFCPYDSAPYLEKFTLFANEKDFSDSTNEGFVILGENSYRIRLDGKEFNTSCDDEYIPLELGKLMYTVAKEYRYLV